MKVTINTQFAKLVVDMSVEHVMDLLSQAVKFASIPSTETADPIPQVTTAIPTCTTNFRYPTNLRHQPPPSENNSMKYKGFMHIKCEECGETKSFFLKYLTDNYKCACGHHTNLVDMKVIHAKCPCCGTSLDYWTNIDAEQLEITCIHCHAPVDVRINKHGDGYDTIK